MLTDAPVAPGVNCDLSMTMLPLQPRRGGRRARSDPTAPTPRSDQPTIGIHFNNTTTNDIPGYWVSSNLSICISALLHGTCICRLLVRDADNSVPQFGVRLTGTNGTPRTA